MSKRQILIVEDDKDTAEMLRIFFTAESYDVDVAMRGLEALELTRRKIPDLVILDIILPEMDGYEIFHQLRTTTRTSHIPIIFLTQKGERNDRIAGLELGADDYVTKPFDYDELKLRVKNAISTSQRLNLTDPRTGLPSARLIEDQLRELIRSKNWTYAMISIEHWRPFHDAYGFVASDEVLRYTAHLLSHMVEKKGTLNDFIGHAGGREFVLVTYAQDARGMFEEIRRQFNDNIVTHYNFLDSEQGGIRQPDGSLAPMMRLVFGVVTDKTQDFTDIREITEAATERMRTMEESGRRG